MRIQLRFLSNVSLDLQVNLYAQFHILKHEQYISKIYAYLRTSKHAYLYALNTHLFIFFEE